MLLGKHPPFLFLSSRELQGRLPVQGPGQVVVDDRLQYRATIISQPTVSFHLDCSYSVLTLVENDFGYPTQNGGPRAGTLFSRNLGHPTITLPAARERVDKEMLLYHG